MEKITMATPIILNIIRKSYRCLFECRILYN